MKKSYLTLHVIVLLQDQNFHYRTHKIPPCDSILSQLNPVQIFTPYFYTIHFNSKLSSHISQDFVREVFP
jgi:hypothetical protein